MVFWNIGRMRWEIKETANAATDVVYGREGGVEVNPEAHVTGDVPDGGVGECGDEIKEFFR